MNVEKTEKYILNIVKRNNSDACLKMECREVCTHWISKRIHTDRWIGKIIEFGLVQKEKN